jgi:hypothetical protein
MPQFGANLAIKIYDHKIFIVQATGCVKNFPVGLRIKDIIRTQQSGSAITIISHSFSLMTDITRSLLLFMNSI